MVSVQTSNLTDGKGLTSKHNWGKYLLHISHTVYFSSEYTRWLDGTYILPPLFQRLDLSLRQRSCDTNLFISLSLFDKFHSTMHQKLHYDIINQVDTKENTLTTSKQIHTTWCCWFLFAVNQHKLWGLLRLHGYMEP